MRLGVSAKIFLAYAAVLGAFAANSIFVLLALHRGREDMNANSYLVRVQGAADLAWQALDVYSKRDDLDSRVAAGGSIILAREHLADADRTIGEYLALDDLSRRRGEFEDYRAEVRDLQQQIKRFLERASREGESARFPVVIVARADRFRTRLRDAGGAIARDLATNEKRAIDFAFLFGGVGVLAALGAGISMMRTLRPLKVLRLQAREIAGGDYARRVGVRSRDEIGDLAREFDGMAQAIQEREQRLIRSERLATVGRMAAHITHEVRNPLASLGLYVELLGDELAGVGDEPRRLVSAIGKELDRLSEITETYLRFVRLPRPKLEREELGALATSVLEFSRAELQAAGIALDLLVAPRLPEVAADENQIRQALLNLVRNAKEAMGGGGRLRVELVEVPTGHVRLTVADTGSGIAPENLAKIFEPFFSTKDKGTGLGLALVQQIVIEHGGRIEAQSPPGGGTAFVMTFPAAAEPAVSVAASAAETASSERLPAGSEALKAH